MTYADLPETVQEDISPQHSQKARRRFCDQAASRDTID